MVLLFTVNLVCTSSCKPRTVNEVRPIYPPKQEPPTAVEKVLSLAKGFALGTNDVDDVDTAFNALNSDEMKELADRRRKNEDFVQFVVAGKASDRSRAIVKKYLDTYPSAGTAAKTQLSCLGMVSSLRAAKRPKDEDNVEYQRLLGLVLHYCPTHINDLQKSDKSFDGDRFNKLVDVLDATQTQTLLNHLNAKHFDTWLDRVFATSAKGTFRMLLAKANATTKTMMRSRLLQKHYVADPVQRVVAMGTLIDETASWGIDVNTDEFILSTSMPGTSFVGSLLYVLTKRAIEENSRTPTKPRSAFEELREYAQRIKAVINDPAIYRAHVTATYWGGQLLKYIDELLTDALAHGYEDFVLYYLALDTPKIVYDAVTKPEADVSNKILTDLYNKIINSDAQAVLLAAEQDPPGAPLFIHHLLKRTIDGDTNELLDRFLTSQGSVMGERNQVISNAGGRNAIQILSDVARVTADAPEFKVPMFTRLLRNDDGTGVNLLSKPELTPVIDEMYLHRGLGETGPARFKFLYNLLTPPNKEVARNLLLNKGVVEGAFALQGLIDRMAEVSDPWGLRAGLTSDNYSFDGVVTGSLLYVLTKKAIATDTLDTLRGYAHGIKGALNLADYTTHVTVTAWNTEVIKNLIETKLGPSKADFADYYLFRESEQNVFDAAASPEAVVPNAVVKELYDLIIGNSTAKTTTLAAASNANGKFLHHMLKRSIDATTHTRFVVNKYLNSRGMNEVLDLEDATGGEKPLKIVLKSTRAAGDNTLERKLLLERLLKNVGGAPTVVTGVDAADLSVQISGLSAAPQNFKNLYALFAPASAQALLMRSALVANALDKGDAITQKLVAEITDPLDIWGLKAGISNDGYQIDKKPALGGYHEGSLLYVLSAIAVDDYVPVDKQIFAQLGQLALLIKNSFATRLDYENYVNVTRVGAQPQTITYLLTAPTGGLAFAKSYLGIGEVADLFALAKNPAVPSLELKELYNLVVGNDVNLAYDLSLQANLGEKFIHRLLSRPADKDTAFILDKFLTGLFVHAGNTPGEEIAQLNDNSLGAGRYPLQILAATGRALDDNGQKANMFRRLLQHDDGTASGALAVPDLFAQKFFTAGTTGRNAFTALYSKLAPHPALQQALRSGLLADAYESKPDGLVGPLTLITEIMNATDPWGLKASIETDIYEMEKNPVALDRHVGTMLFVLTLRAMDDAAALAKSKFAPYEGLRKIAGKFNTDFPLTYLAYVNAINPVLGISAKDALKARLDVLNPGFAEYYLLDTSLLADADAAQLVFRASGVKSDINVLKWLYDTYVTDPVALVMAPLVDINNNNFVHQLAKKEVNATIHSILTDFFTKLTTQPALRTTAVSSVNGDGKNPIAIWNGKVLQAGHGRNILSTMVKYANQAALEAITPNANEVDKLMERIKKDGDALMNLFMQTGDQTRLEMIAEWTGSEAKNFARAGSDPALFAPAFWAKYSAVGPAQKRVMRNKLFSGAVKGVAGKVALDNIGLLTVYGFLDQAELADNDFDIGAGISTTLLYAAIAQFPLSTKDDIGDLVRNLKGRFLTIAEWQKYLDDATNNTAGGGPESIVALVTRIAGSDAAAKDWLQYH